MPLLSITRQLSPHGIVQRLQQDLEETEVSSRATSLAFFEVLLDEEISKTIRDYFQQVAAATSNKQRHDTTTSRRRRLFSELNFYLVPRNFPYMDQVLATALFVDIFGKLHIKGTRDPNYDPPSIHRGLQNLPSTRNLRQLQLSYMTLSRQDAVTLKRGLLSASVANSSSSQIEQLLLSNVILLRENEQEDQDNDNDANGDSVTRIGGTTATNSALEELTQGFAQNETLQIIAMSSCGLKDDDVAKVMTSLVNHSSLKSLRLFGNACRRQGLEAVAKLLASDESKLESLDLHHQSVRRRTISNNLLVEGGTVQQQPQHEKVSLEAFIQAWPQSPYPTNTCLQKLNLSGNRLNNQDIPAIATLLQRLMGLHELDLGSNQISNVGLERLALDTCPKATSTCSRLCVLRLTQNPITQQAACHVVQLLENFPQLYVLACPTIVNTNWKWSSSTDPTSYKQQILHLLDINRAGRVLLRQPASTIRQEQKSPAKTALPSSPRSKRPMRQIPLSVWAIVLARVNHVHSSKNIHNMYLWRGSRHGRENGLYYLLRHGPVLMERRDNDPRCASAKRNGSGQVVMRPREKLPPMAFSPIQAPRDEVPDDRNDNSKKSNKRLKMSRM